MRVWFESWEVDCCGTPFSVGSSVNWFVERLEDLSEFARFDIPACAEAELVATLHPGWEKLALLEGTVTGVEAVFHRAHGDCFEAGRPGSICEFTVVPVTMAPTGLTVVARPLWGYAVEVDGCVLPPPTPES